MSNVNWSELVGQGCIHAIDGKYPEAIDHWERADHEASKHADWGDVRLNPPLCLLRYKVGEAPGIVHSPIPSEDLAIGVYFSDDVTESDSPRGMELLGTPTKECFQNYEFDPGPLTFNIKKELPHLMVLSTGRCGTISLARLLNRSQYLTYHSCLINPSSVTRHRMMAQVVSGNQEVTNPEWTWASCRSAEWIGAINEDRPLALVSHQDTVFAPCFAKIHPLSKFIYLRRDPVKVFESFYTKKQWSLRQIQPIYYKFPFQWHVNQMDHPATLAWYIKFTEDYSRGFGEVMGDRFIEISSDKLFDLDPTEIRKLMDFAEIDLPYQSVADHFRQKHNEKIHKRDDTNLEAGREAFLKAYDSL